MSAFIKVSKAVLPVSVACYVVNAKSACKPNPPVIPDQKKKEMMSPANPKVTTDAHNYTMYKYVPNEFKLYKMSRDFVYDTGIKHFAADHFNEELNYRIVLTPDGILTIHKGFIWNGPTACYPFDCTMRGSLAHDAFYELFSEKVGAIDRDSVKTQVDELLGKMFDDDGCNPAFSRLAVLAVRYGSKLVEE